MEWKSMRRTMKPEEDAYGQEVLAYHNGKEVFEVVERDDGYISVSTPRMYFSDYESWSPQERKALEFAKGKVLDVGCGVGRHSLYLQKRGFDVLGIDKSPLAIEVCKLRGLRKAKVMSVEEANFKPNSFDTILMLGGNFGLLGSLKKAQRLLKRFHRMTSENALILADTRDPYKTDNPAHLEYHEVNRKRGRMAGQARIRVRFEKYATKWLDYLLVSREEMKQILKGTGWKIKDFIDSENASYIGIAEKSG
jgi:2-polyprenyl-3-methyl-5-hydroxy-6-metoxy-1,4-benzoquinol methylase